MNFFDGLLYADAAAMIALQPVFRLRFSAAAEKTLPGVPEGRERMSAFCRLQLRWMVAVLALFGGALLCLFLGSMPKEMAEVRPAFGFLLLFCILGITAGGILIGRYFIGVAEKHDVFRASSATGRPVFFYRRTQLGAGIFLSFYIFLVLFFAGMDLFYLIGLL